VEAAKKPQNFVALIAFVICGTYTWHRWFLMERRRYFDIVNPDAARDRPFVPPEFRQKCNR
jgi:hypothetical protein